MKSLKRKLILNDELASQLARAAIRANPIRGLVELVTNSDDSLKRIAEDRDGRIRVGIKRGHDRGFLLVSDNAEGMNKERMDLCVGGFAFSTSGFRENRKVRGLFGRGLKEAIMGLGRGIVSSIHDEVYYECSLDEERNYESNEGRKAMSDDYEELQLNRGENGTQVAIEIMAKENNVLIPRFESLKEGLQKHVSLRDIMTNPRRILTLTDVSKSLTERLSYRYPEGKTIISKMGVKIEGYPDATLDIEIRMANEDLSQGEADYLRDGGLLVRSGTAIHEATLFRFDDDEYAKRFFGNLRCDYIDELIIEKESVISGERDGLDRKHPFVRALQRTVEAILAPFVAEEKRRVLSEKKQLETAATQARFQTTIDQMNEIAKLELETIEGPVEVFQGPNEGQKQARVIMFEFVPKYVQIVSGKEETLYLKASVPKIVPDGTRVEIESDNIEVKVITRVATIEEASSHEGVVTCRIKLEGRQVGATAIVTARAGPLKAMATVKIISVKPKIPPHTPSSPPKAGLFRKIEMDNSDSPTQRAHYDKETGIIKIYTKSDSVSMYLGPNGENQEEPHCQVLIAELVTDVICRAIAKRRKEKGYLLILSDKSELDAIDREHERLRGKYAALIHSGLVSKSIHRKELEIENKGSDVTDNYLQ